MGNKSTGRKKYDTGEEGSFRIFLAHFFFFGNTLRVCMTEERISRTCNVDNNCAR